MFMAEQFFNVFSPLHLSWLLACCGYCSPQVDGGFSGSHRLRDAGGEGWSGNDHSGLSRVGRLWGSSSLSAGYGARARHRLCWVACWGCSSHSSSLLGDLVDDGLHELRGQSWEVDRCHSCIQWEVSPEKHIFYCVHFNLCCPSDQKKKEKKKNLMHNSNHITEQHSPGCSRPGALGCPGTWEPAAVSPVQHNNIHEILYIYHISASFINAVTHFPHRFQIKSSCSALNHVCLAVSNPVISSCKMKWYVGGFD